jgi:hypothetical protein
MTKKPEDILLKLASLHAQATEERSHYYVGSCVREAIAEITWLRSQIDALKQARQSGE